MDVPQQPDARHINEDKRCDVIFKHKSDIIRSDNMEVILQMKFSEKRTQAQQRRPSVEV